MKLTSEIISIINAGGNVKVDCKSKMTCDLIAMAQAAANKGITLIFSNADSKMTSELISIVTAGKGHVIIKLA